MSHLTLVPALDQTDEIGRPRLSNNWDEPCLDIPGLPPPILSPMESPQTRPDTDDVHLPVAEPELQVMLDEVDALFAGTDPETARKIGDGFYIDGDSRPRTTHGLLRSVPN